MCMTPKWIFTYSNGVVCCVKNWEPDSVNISEDNINLNLNPQDPFSYRTFHMNIYLLGTNVMNAKRMIREYKSHRRPAPSEFKPGKPKYKPYGKIKDHIELGVWSPPSAEEGRSKCDLNLKPGVSKVTLEKIKERLLMSHTKGIKAVPYTSTQVAPLKLMKKP